MDMSHVESLLKKGYVVLPITKEEGLEVVWRSCIFNALRLCPVYDQLYLEGSPIYVQGGFGALGNPGSFHLPIIRTLRCVLYDNLLPFFKEYAKRSGLSENTYIAQLFDRLCIRRGGTSTTKESWHRDLAVLDGEDQEIFGGWLNLGSYDSKTLESCGEDGTQKFICVEATHWNVEERKINAKDSKSGFSTNISRQSKAYYNKHKTVVEVPPRHVLLFNQSIVHCVAPTKTPLGVNTLRLFSGWHLYDSKKPNIKGSSLYNNHKCIESQGCPLLPSKQKVPMFPQLHYCFRKDSLIEWSKSAFKSCCLTTKGKTGEEYKVVQRFMPSLKELKLPMFVEYTPREKKIMTLQPLFEQENISKRRMTQPNSESRKRSRI